MAYDLWTGFRELTATSDHPVPTRTPPSRDNEIITHDNSEVGGGYAEIAGHHDGLGLSTPPLSSRASDSDLEWLVRAQDAGQGCTQPIDVPLSPGAGDRDRAADNDAVPDSRYQEISPLEDFMRNRRPSISFSPQVTLESGHRRPLEEPLPKLAIDTRGRRSSILQREIARQPDQSFLPNSHRPADSADFDALDSELLFPSQLERSGNASGSQEDQSLSPPLQSTDHSAGGDKGLQVPERKASLTSESTASPVVSEIQTPKEGMDILLSPVTAFPSFPYPTSLEDSSAWPKPRRQGSSSRAKSYTFERKSSMRQSQRQNSRSSRRSTSSSISPATAFLSRFARNEEPAPVQDSEGQEVGEYVLGKKVGFGGFSTVREAYTIEGEERICRAVKIVRKQVTGRADGENEQLQAEFEHEVRLWRCLGHRNILPLIEVYETGFATFCFTKLNTGGTLFDLVRVNRHGLGRDLARRYAYQLASAIRYLHEDVRIVHRDIKLENCLIDVSDPDVARDGGNLLLCDFGLAEFVTKDTRRNSPDPYERTSDRPPPKNIGPSDSSTSIAGSLQYASPELIMSPAGFLSSVVDVWAYGVAVFALLVGDLPFQHTLPARVQRLILAGEWSMADLVKADGVLGYEEETLEFVAGCLEMQSEQRWEIGNVLKSRWLEGCQEMLEELNESWKL